MSDLRDLYQEVILDHNRQPRNLRELADATHKAEGYNPLCGDRVTVFVRVVGGVIEEVTFEGVGCAISTASASMLTEILRGKSLEEARSLFDSFGRLVKGDPTGESSSIDDEDRSRLGKLEVFQGVCEFPTRVKCATLVWHTLASALEASGGEASGDEPVSTE
ncbi:MAG: SUF system NifU family Fe-S cluster assembly protein [Planctomycetes bacterium]|nr:SUF system NifU family Fe-S cluster assembly protein [Planctomycetota bacterium]